MRISDWSSDVCSSDLFEYFYGFNAGDTNQWAPALVENTRTVEPPTGDPTYILDKDLADHAIDWLHVQQSTQPGRPFLMYIAPGTAHVPNHAPKEWIEKFRGPFDKGWDQRSEERRDGKECVSTW